MMAAVEQLDVRTVTETGEGWSVTRRIIPIIAGVELHVYDESLEAVLIFNDSAEIEFTWTDEAATMFGNIDVTEPIELLELLSRLNKKLEDDMQARRMANGFGGGFDGMRKGV